MGLKNGGEKDQSREKKAWGSTRVELENQREENFDLRREGFGGETGH